MVTILALLRAVFTCSLCAYCSSMTFQTRPGHANCARRTEVVISWLGLSACRMSGRHLRHCAS